jgi:hypothetical protein
MANARLSVKQAIANGVKCSYKRLQQTRSITFTKLELSRLKELKIMENENLNKFYGICFNQQNELIVLWILCHRGSLEVPGPGLREFIPFLIYLNSFFNFNNFFLI